jgi:hypothetical protein
MNQARRHTPSQAVAPPAQSSERDLERAQKRAAAEAAFERAQKRAAAEAAFERAAIEAIALRLQGRHSQANEAARKARWLYQDWKQLEDPAP